MDKQTIETMNKIIQTISVHSTQLQGLRQMNTQYGLLFEYLIYQINESFGKIERHLSRPSGFPVPSFEVNLEGFDEWAPGRLEEIQKEAMDMIAEANPAPKINL